MADALVDARGLTKHFGELVAVDEIDFEVRAGEAFGFLGPNGAGKSSTMKMIGAVSPRTEGSLSVLGRDPDEKGQQIRARLGVVPPENIIRARPWVPAGSPPTPGVTSSVR